MVNLLVFLFMKPKQGCTKYGLCVVNVCLYIYKRGRWHRKESWGERKVAYQISQPSISRMLKRWALSNICFYGAHYESIRFLWLSKAITCPLRCVAAWCMVLFPIVRLRWYFQQAKKASHLIPDPPPHVPSKAARPLSYLDVSEEL